MTRRKAIFIDRGGVIHREFGSATTGRPRDLVLEKGVLKALKRIDRTQFFVFLFDNPDGLALGEYSEQSYEKLTQRLLQTLKRRRIAIDGLLCCPYHPQGKGRFRKDSVFRFPNVGLFKQAQQEHELDLASSWVIGDRTRELLAAGRSRCRSILVRTGEGGRDGEYFVEPDAVVGGLAEAVQLIHEQELALWGHP